jgi:hypothetical protein
MQLLKKDRDLSGGKTSKWRGHAKSIGFAAAAAVFVIGFSTAASAHDDDDTINWTRNGAPRTTSITGGPWTLEQSGAANGLKSSGYCDSNMKQIGNPGTERMEPYYFPVTLGTGSQLQGYFDWRPKDTDEAVVAATSSDSGQTWTFEDKVLELRTHCPDQANKEPDGEKDAVGGNNADNGDDDGQGHQFVINIAGHTYLYTLNRSANHIDSDPLVIHDLSPQAGDPLHGAPALDDGPTDTMNTLPEPALHTVGLLHPDGILGVVPGSSPLEIIYEEKILNGDNTGSTAFTTPSQICNNNPGWANFYTGNPLGTAPNDDITFLHLASTTDGINFTEKGILKGLNDIHTVSADGVRWLATAVSIIKKEGGGFGLLYSGGNCIDGDSDAFHFIGYAESSDLINWTVINGIDHPIASVFPVTITVDSNGVPASSGTSLTLPKSTPVVGNTDGFFAGRVYAPRATQNDEKNVTVVFAGYHTQKPKNGLGDYRTIGKVSLHSSEDISQIGSNNSIDHDHNH